MKRIQTITMFLKKMYRTQSEAMPHVSIAVSHIQYLASPSWPQEFQDREPVYHQCPMKKENIVGQIELGPIHKSHKNVFD